jgi:hypothetical protein
MKDHSLAKLGGLCSILVGISYVVIGICYALIPIEQRPGGSPAQLLASVAQNSTMILIEYWAFALGACFALAAVFAITERVRAVNDGWARWSSYLAFIGFAVTAVTYFRLMAQVPRRAALFATGDATLRSALAATQVDLYLDPQGWMGFGAIGLWVLVVSVLAFRANLMPKPLVYIGIGAGVLYWLVVAGYVTGIETLTAFSAALGGIVLGPIWYIWNGILLLREAQAQVGESANRTQAAALQFK